MRQLIERLKTEKFAIEREKLERYQTESQGRQQAYNAGKAIARTWIQNSSYLEIKDVLHHLTAQKVSNDLRSKIHIYFTLQDHPTKLTIIGRDISLNTYWTQFHFIKKFLEIIKKD